MSESKNKPSPVKDHYPPYRSRATRYGRPRYLSRSYLSRRICSRRSLCIGITLGLLYIYVYLYLDHTVSTSTSTSSASPLGTPRPYVPNAQGLTSHYGNRLSLSCLETWLAEGSQPEAERCIRQETKGLDDRMRMDGVWMWVNGSDPIWAEEKHEWARREGVGSPNHHFREHDELRYSLRSASLFPFSYIHLLVARLSTGSHQIPSWLRLHPLLDNTAVSGSIETNDLTTLYLRTHDEALNGTYLPTFSSGVVESGIWRLDNLSPISLAFNDDFFITRPLARRDFYSISTGPVFRFDDNYYQQVRPSYSATHHTDSGEVGSLLHANALLSARFPRRIRPYLAHAPKVVIRHIHEEVSRAFTYSIDVASKRRFRESTTGEGGIGWHWLAAAWQVERWREALIWTFVVGRLGVEGEVREGLEEVWRVGVGMGDKRKAKAGLTFTSLDGYLPPLLLNGQRPIPCPSLDHCLGPLSSIIKSNQPVSSADLPNVFKRFAMTESRCGDCLVEKLVHLSGERGLSAFLPPKTRPSFLQSIRRSVTKLRVEGLPVEVDGDFALPTEAKGREREWCLRLLARYVYSTAPRNDHFISLTQADGLQIELDEANASNDVETITLNDDIHDPTQEEGVRGIIQGWMARRYPKRRGWEL